MKTILTFFFLALVTLQANSSPLIIPITISGKLGGNKIAISWSITENELAHIFELEKSLDGKNFTTCALIFATAKNGAEQYQVSEKSVKQSQVSYRVKLLYKSEVVAYSNTLLFQLKEEKEAKKLQLIGNPVTSSAIVSYDAAETQPQVFHVYSAAGKYLFSQKANDTRSNQLFTIPVSHLQQNSYFIIEVVFQDGRRETIKFLKR